YRLLNSGEEDEVYENAENRAKLTGSNVIPIVTDRLKAQVMELDGDRNKTFISQSIDHMLGVDINALRKRIREIEPGIDLFPKVKAPSGAECTAYIPMSLEFFWID